MKRGFTVIELLVVIGITVILALVVITTLNPVEILGQSRDAKRLSEIESVDGAIEFALSQDLNLDIGDPNIIYLSLPDDDPACGSYTDLPPLDTVAGWSYRCSSQANFRNIDGTGWLPVNFASLPTSPFTTLPVDPVNDASRGLYYAYVTGGSWELNVQLESEKYSFSGGADMDSTDGGDTIVLYETGNDLGLLPPEASSRVSEIIASPALSCQDNLVFFSNFEGYSKWTIPGEGEVAVTGIMFWSRHTAGPVEQVAIFEEDGARISEVVLVPYVGNNIWSSSTLDVPVRINLGQTYSFGFAPVDALSARIAYDDLSDCSSYSPSEGSKYNGASDHILDTSVPGGDVDSGRYGFFGIKYSR